jgi:hypothetical protein
MKQLIYFTICHNRNYLKLLDLCVTSLIKSGYDGDILFITDLENDIKQILNIKNNVLFFDPKESNFISSSANKLKIFKFEDIKNYKKIIFCDLDILWLKHPQEIFDTIEDGNIYISEEGIDNRHNMSLCFYSEKLISEEERKFMWDNNIIGLNAGFFGFHINMLYILENVYSFMEQNHDKITGCLEQPFLNVYCFRNKNYKTDFTKFISHKGQDLEKCNKHVLHFAGGVGNFTVKYNKMIEHLNKNSVIKYETRNDMFLSFPKNLKILEIGVFRGDFSDFIFKNLEPKELHLVDLFEGIMDSGNQDGNNSIIINLNDSFNNLKNKYLNNNKLFLHKGFSYEVLNKFDDNHFDLIYLDGDHSYEGVKKDLIQSFKKIKNGGYICGHDYETNNLKTNNFYNFGVKKAVDEFCKEYKQNINMLAYDGCISFGIKISK